MRYANIEVTEENYGDIFSDDDAFVARIEQLREKHYADDVRKMYQVWEAGTGVSDLACQLLMALHRKRGSFDLMSMCKFDIYNQSIALRLIEICGGSSILSDDGLGEVLTAEQVEELELSCLAEQR